ncbi:aminotransferase class IV family protein [Streptacidiphilus sp. EB103A]|uniref:aminotransferase class IV family protein n=1 Tax=Streptacidiphilus sp. EB103A TaxID=3156275 RepID=UPI003513C450
MPPQLNGRPATESDLIPLGLVNYGHFTSMRVDDGHVRGLSLHLDRLVDNCAEVFNSPLDREQTLALIRDAATDDGRGPTGSFTIRVTVYDPDLEMGHPGLDAHPQVLVTTRPAGGVMPPLTVALAEYQREVPSVKHIGLMGTIYYRRKAQRAGFGDVLFAGADGLISEGATWNIGFVNGAGEVVWPKADVLDGVTMRLLQENSDHTVAPVSRTELGDMAAAFATNTSVGVRPISRIGTIEFDDQHPTLTALSAVYAAIPGERLL